MRHRRLRIADKGEAFSTLKVAVYSEVALEFHRRHEDPLTLRRDFWRLHILRSIVPKNWAVQEPSCPEVFVMAIPVL